MRNDNAVPNTSARMKTPFSCSIGIVLAIWTAAAPVPAQGAPAFSGAQVLTNSEVQLHITAAANQNIRLEVSSDLSAWTGLTTYRSTGSDQVTDSAAPSQAARFYRALTADAGALTGDHFATDLGEGTIHPINHATFVMRWNNRVIYSDPVGGAGRFQGLPRADLIFVTHTHGDHLDAPTLTAVRGTNALLIAPAAVFSALPASLRSITTVLTNGAKTNLLDLEIEAVPAYNANHPRGAGNGYVLTLGGQRIYVSGDTGDIPEMRALPDIDIAFVCMNLPFTMSVDTAAGAVRAFRPRVVYPYHYSNSDLNRFKRLVGGDVGVEVRLRNWY